MPKKPKWIEFHLQPRPVNKKTDTWQVINIQYAFVLGVVKWYGPFRKYSFFTEPNIVYETTCLIDLARFCQQANIQHKLKKQMQNAT